MAGPNSHSENASIGRGDGCISETPDVGDYEDGHASAPDGVLFSGAQSTGSSELHGKA